MYWMSAGHTAYRRISWLYWWHTMDNKHEKFVRCWPNTGPESLELTQNWANVSRMSRFFCLLINWDIFVLGISHIRFYQALYIFDVHIIFVNEQWRSVINYISTFIWYDFLRLEMRVAFATSSQIYVNKSSCFIQFLSIWASRCSLV